MQRNFFSENWLIGPIYILSQNYARWKFLLAANPLLLRQLYERLNLTHSSYSWGLRRLPQNIYSNLITKQWLSVSSCSDLILSSLDLKIRPSAQLVSSIALAYRSAAPFLALAHLAVALHPHDMLYFVGRRSLFHPSDLSMQGRVQTTWRRRCYVC